MKHARRKDYLFLWVEGWVGLVDSLIQILSFGRIDSDLRSHYIFSAFAGRLTRNR